MNSFRVLIIDDTRSVHNFVKAIMAPYRDINFVDVFNGAEAIALLERDKAFDLILLDWEMPVKNGPETFEGIKDLGVQVPTMMMTTKNAMEDIEKMLMAGVGEYLMKPFTVEIILEKIEMLCGRTFSRAA